MDKFDLSTLKDVQAKIKQDYSQHCYETPVLDNMHLRFAQLSVKSLALKLESIQCQGSFKVRGVINQFLNLSADDRNRTLTTMSAGNYGKAFAYIARLQSMPAVVFMSDSAPVDRREAIKGLGADVVICRKEELLPLVERHGKDHGSLFFHSFDDPHLIAGVASAGLELVGQLESEPDIIVVCCGGGGLLSGVALAVRLSGWKHTKIYGVEPQNACTMYEAFEHGKVVDTKVSSTIASGLSPPFAGKLCYDVLKESINGIILVTDDEIKRGMKFLYQSGLVVEPSGAAAFSAVMAEKIPHSQNRNVVAFLTGGNILPSDMTNCIG